MAKLLMRALAVFLVLPVIANAQECGTPAAVSDGWTRATPAEVGLDAERLCGLDKLLEQWPQGNIHAVVVARRGKLVMERYFTGPDERWGRPLGELVTSAAPRSWDQRNGRGPSRVPT